MIEPLFQISKEEETAEYGRFVLEPLASGFGHTLGTALRRVLLTALAGAAVTRVKIAGVRHQFTTLTGLKEDIVELILNIKQLRLSYEGDKPVTLKLEANGPGEIKAKNIKTPAGVKIANPELVIASLADKKAKLKVEMTVEKGCGYVPFEEIKTEGEIGLVPVDALFSPVRRVNYQVVATRVGRMTNLDKLILEIWTDATVKPGQVLKKAAALLVEYFQQVAEPKKPVVKSRQKEEEIPGELSRLSVEELSLPVRVANTLIRAKLLTVADLVGSGRKKVSRVKNLGAKSLTIVEAALAEKGLSLGD